MAAIASIRDEDNTFCRSCHTAALRVDWSQGDRICTYCGVVDEERLLDDRPEWRDYNNDADDTLREKARSGLVLVDEKRYFGGIQPTCLSKYVHGAPYKSSATTRKTLVRVNRKLERNMEKMHGKAVQDAKLVRLIAAKGRELESSDCEIRPEIEQLLVQEEEDANRLQQALNANKWSLSRALRLFGSDQEQVGNAHDPDDDEALDAKLDNKLRQCARDLYQAYTMLYSAARALKLPERVATDAVRLLCEYTARRDGIIVRGVSSTLQRKESTTVVKPCDKQHERATQALREYNKSKQAGALVAAILLYAGRRHQHERSIQDICASIKPPALETSTLDTSGEFIKKKHCSRAMKEIEVYFPEVIVQSATVAASAALHDQGLADNSSASMLNYVDHLIQQLCLPPVAEASVRLLCLYWHQKLGSDVKLSTICGVMTYFICSVGTTMKRLASQATKSKKRKLSCLAKQSEAELVDDKMNEALMEELEITREQRAYEMMRAWDAWQEQMPWSKSIADIEQCCGTSSNVLLEYYQHQVHPRRLELLAVLKNSVNGTGAENSSLMETPLASVLLPQIAVAAPLLRADG